jgi:S1-C subfamily serine protease
MTKHVTPVLILLLLCSLFASAREWKSADGSKTFEGQLVSYAPPSVTVVRSDGRRLTFSDSKLSDADKRYCTLASRVLGASYPSIPYRVIQVLDGGVLGRELADRNPYNSNELFFIWGNYLNTAAEEDTYRHNIYWAGSYHYTTVGGQQKTIRSFAPSLDEAVAIWEFRLNPPKDVAKNESPYSGITRESLSSSGTGFAVTSDGHIVTNAHVIEGATSISVLFDGAKTKAEVLAIDKQNDLAILKINQKTQPLHIETADTPSLGDSITVAGFPNPSIQGRSLKITKGTLSSLKGMQDDIRHFQIDAAVQPGNSGGPLLAVSGSVVGVVNARLNDAAVALATGSLPQNVNYAIKVDYLTPLTKTVPGLRKLIEGVDGVTRIDMDQLGKRTVFLIESEIKN